MLSLGVWQLDRAEFKMNLESMIEDKRDMSKVPFYSDIFDSDNWLYTPVTASGYYDISKQVLLDNQVYNMRAGYSVYTPFMITDRLAILVDRGWLPITGERSQLPDIAISNNSTIALEGILVAQPSKGIVLSDMANNYEKWPAVLQYIDASEISEALPYQLLPGVLKLQSLDFTHLTTLPIKSSFNSEKHHAYAFQWFSLSLALLIIYIVVNTKRHSRSE